ncbi:MAG: tRNA-uridine 2-sulfurtransferase [Acidimicrobiaceae bacterium]|jgi:tRNA-specific 2-thiouridylase|nr:tRNA-uridine 2-sulfurtransferase [Acidimicrobiaceae bacterium]
MSRVLVAMSGGVDSSVAAALLIADGHEVVGATMKLWGGDSDSGCCSVADVEDARRVAQQLGIAHHVFNFGSDFDAHVVEPYVAAHAEGRTPNPCVECNRHLKFDRFLRRATQLGFDAVATGHHARVVRDPAGGRYRLRRGVDQAKDQSYVLHMLDQAALARTLLPVGALTKAEVRTRAADLGLRTAAKPDSQDVCFITSTGGRHAFLGSRIPLRPGLVIDDDSGEVMGSVPAVELVTVGQRRGLGDAGDARRRYVVDVDLAAATVTVGSRPPTMERLAVGGLTWVDEPVAAGASVLVQCSAHGDAVPAMFDVDGDGEVDGAGAGVRFEQPHRVVAPGQSVVLYDGDDVLGGGVALASASALPDGGR